VQLKATGTLFLLKIIQNWNLQEPELQIGSLGLWKKMLIGQDSPRSKADREMYTPINADNQNKESPLFHNENGLSPFQMLLLYYSRNEAHSETMYTFWYVVAWYAIWTSSWTVTLWNSRAPTSFIDSVRFSTFSTLGTVRVAVKRSFSLHPRTNLSKSDWIGKHESNIHLFLYLIWIIMSSEKKGSALR